MIRSETSGLPASGEYRIDTARVEARLAQLERSNARLRRVAAAVAVSAAAVLCMGAGSAARIPDVLAARAFEIVGAGGELRAVLTAPDARGVRVVVYDDAGEPSATLRLAAVEPHFTVERVGDRGAAAPGPVPSSAGAGAAADATASGAASSAASVAGSAGVAGAPASPSPAPPAAAERVQQAGQPQHKKRWWPKWGGDEPDQPAVETEEDTTFDWDDDQ